VGAGSYSEPRYSASSPHLLIYVLRDESSPASVRLDAPVQGVDQGSSWSLANSQPNIDQLLLLKKQCFRNNKVGNLSDSEKCKTHENELD
jgi:hypothetical protein